MVYLIFFMVLSPFMICTVSFIKKTERSGALLRVSGSAVRARIHTVKQSRSSFFGVVSCRPPVLTSQLFNLCLDLYIPAGV